MSLETIAKLDEGLKYLLLADRDYSYHMKTINGLLGRSAGNGIEMMSLAKAQEAIEYVKPSWCVVL